jgi:radical SAM protein with 4Fe4S-binding SPASM domain
MTDMDGGPDVLREFELQARASATLLNAHIDLTYRCDLACVHCYLEVRKKKELTTQQLVKLLDELQALGVLFINFSGGDLFLRPDAVEVIRAAAERRFAVEIKTHAGHITEEVARALADTGGVTMVAVSIYSSQAESHDRVTRVRGSLHKTLRGIVNLREAGIAVKMMGIVMADNLNAHLEIPLLAAKYDCTYDIAHSIHPPREGHIDRGRPRPNTEVGCRDLRNLSASFDQRVDIVRRLYAEPGSFRMPRHSPDEGICGAGTSGIYVDPEGTVFPCVLWEEQAGSLHESSMADIWESATVFEQARALKRRDFEGCTSCGNFSHCALCPGKAYMESGSHSGVSPTKCLESETIWAAFGSE